MRKSCVKAVEIAWGDAVAAYIFCTHYLYTCMSWWEQTLGFNRFTQQLTPHPPTDIYHVFISVMKDVFPTIHHTYNYNNYIFHYYK